MVTRRRERGASQEAIDDILSIALENYNGEDKELASRLDNLLINLEVKDVPVSR